MNQAKEKNRMRQYGVFSGSTIAMCIATIFMWGVSGVSSPGTTLGAARSGVFAGLTIAIQKRAQKLESKMGV